MSISASEKKTTETVYNNLEQVRDAACAWCEALSQPPRARQKQYQQAAQRIAYYQHRNQQARKSHTKTTRRRLRRLGVKLSQLPSCVPRNW